VDADTVDRMYMDKVYFMGPDKAATGRSRCWAKR